MDEVVGQAAVLVGGPAVDRDPGAAAGQGVRMEPGLLPGEQSGQLDLEPLGELVEDPHRDVDRAALVLAVFRFRDIEFLRQLRYGGPENLPHFPDPVGDLFDFFLHGRTPLGATYEPAFPPLGGNLANESSRGSHSMPRRQDRLKLGTAFKYPLHHLVEASAAASAGCLPVHPGVPPCWGGWAVVAEASWDPEAVASCL